MMPVSTVNVSGELLYVSYWYTVM